MPVTEKFDVGQYMPLAHAEIDAALAAGRRPIVVGGTGLYLRGALADLSLEKAAPGRSRSCGPRRPATRRCWSGLTMDRERLYERIDRRVEAIVAGGAEAEVRAAEAAGPSQTARKALGFDELLAGDVDGPQEAQPQLRAAPAHVDAQDGRARGDRRDRDQRRRMPPRPSRSYTARAEEAP